MIALVTGAFAAAAALVFVLWPLFRAAGGPSVRARRVDAPAASDSAVRALREIEFDRATGKLADADYANLKAEYTTRAVAELRDADLRAAGPAAMPGGPAAGGADAADSLIRVARGAVIVCVHCDSVRPEPDARYCSACGRPIAAV